MDATRADGGQLIRFMWCLLVVLWCVPGQGVAHIHATGPAPALSSCGTTPSAVTGNDRTGTFTVGTGVVTACTLTFAKAWTSAPNCFLASDTAATLTATAVSTTALTLGFSISLPGARIYYLCEGSQ